MRIHALLFLLFSQSVWALYGSRPVAPQKHLVQLAMGKSVFCEGTVIALNKVLTTAHCIEGKGLELRENSQLLVYYPDTLTVIQGNQKVRAKAVTIAASYYDSLGNLSPDLALIELASPLKNAEVLPVAPQVTLVSGANLLLTTVGEEAPTKLRKVFAGRDGLVMTSEGSRSGVCQGDSGGALILVRNGKKYLAGILSAQSEGCARQHSVSYYPRTTF